MALLASAVMDILILAGLSEGFLDDVPLQGVRAAAFPSSWEGPRFPPCVIFALFV